MNKRSLLDELIELEITRREIEARCEEIRADLGFNRRPRKPRALAVAAKRAMQEAEPPPRRKVIWTAARRKKQAEIMRRRQAELRAAKKLAEERRGN